jgi:hypothetical protein
MPPETRAKLVTANRAEPQSLKIAAKRSVPGAPTWPLSAGVAHPTGRTRYATASIPTLRASSAIRPRPGGCWPTLMPDAQRRRTNPIGRPRAYASDRLPGVREAQALRRREAHRGAWRREADRAASDPCRLPEGKVRTHL